MVGQNNSLILWAEAQEYYPKHWYGLKFFNVYGYNEAPKNRMASVIFHFYNQTVNRTV
jgi:ADP-L-glycero-D-manno-heptose 6-epimerase